MEIVQEFGSSSGPRKAYIVETSLGPRVAIEAEESGEISDYPQRGDDGEITFADPDSVPKYVQNLAKKAFKALDDLRDSRHHELSFTDWLLEQIKRGDVIGSLAKDVSGDDGWPDDGTRYADFADYLDAGPQNPSAVIALSRAWSEYVRETGVEDS
jgi:uncharacterized protein YozE (UPF0346 family)